MRELGWTAALLAAVWVGFAAFAGEEPAPADDVPGTFYEFEGPGGTECMLWVGEIGRFGPPPTEMECA